MAMRHVRVDPEFDAWFLAHVGAQVKAVTEEIADDARAGCPTDSYDLVLSIDTRYPGRLHGVVIVGTDHWKFVEYPTAPHWIDSHGKWSLRSDDNEYFGRRVWHPGTQETPFMRNALYQRRRLKKLAGV